MKANQQETAKREKEPIRARAALIN